jgi:hypothetical protein
MTKINFLISNCKYALTLLAEYMKIRLLVRDANFMIIDKQTEELNAFLEISLLLAQSAKGRVLFSTIFTEL